MVHAAAANRLPGRRIAVLSPHLDDAVLSVGACIRDTVSGGAEVAVVTVFAGVPASERPAADWDRRGGFVTAGEAAGARREEDRRACRILGAQPTWLSFDEDDRAVADEVVRAALVEAVDAADLVLVPGHPLVHPTHARVARIALESAERLPSLALYLEQPYALWAGADPPDRLEGVEGSLSWIALPPGPAATSAKHRAARSYRSQLPLLSGRIPVLWKLRRYERRAGGERIALIKQ